MKTENVNILAIESSCDETAAAVVCDGRKLLSNVISTQITVHTEYGGVVPEIASRKHMEKITQVVDEALLMSGKTLDDIDAIAVTYGPGLVGSLLVGVSFGKSLAFATGKPLIGVHHIEGHIAANYLSHQDLKPPFICLVVSGGHTHMVRVTNYGEFEILGRTRDDAAGEAFDKVARAIGLGYPGGPKIDKLCKTAGDPTAFAFPRAKIVDSVYDFSFSGIKSAVLNTINQAEMKGEKIDSADLAASFQDAVVSVLVDHSMLAVRNENAPSLAMAGGVASNSYLRKKMLEACEKEGIRLYYPEPILCTDNAAMIGAAAYYEYIKGKYHNWDMNAYPNLKLGERSE